MAGYVYAPEAVVSETDRQGIHNACLDYIESWYTADPDRMRRKKRCRNRSGNTRPG